MSNSGVSDISKIAKDFRVTKEFIENIIKILIKMDYLKEINESDYFKEMPFACKFCPFAKGCSERVPKVFYEVSEKAKKLIKKIKIQEKI